MQFKLAIRSYLLNLSCFVAVKKEVIGRILEKEDFKIKIGEKGCIAGSVAGDGAKMLLCFHGYGQDRKLYQGLFKTVPPGYRLVMIDLPFFGESEWTTTDHPILPVELDAFLQRILKKYPAEEVHLLAFSLGAKIALGLYQATTIPIKSAILISPDGLKIHPLYKFAIYHPIGKRLFFAALRWPKIFLFVLKLLYKLRITDAFKYKFVSRQFETEGKRKLLHDVWRGFAEIRPDLGIIVHKSEDWETEWHVIWGDGDNILPLKLCEDFIEKVNGAKLHVVEGGHFLLNPPQESVKSFLHSTLNP